MTPPRSDSTRLRLALASTFVLLITAALVLVGTAREETPSSEPAAGMEAASRVDEAHVAPDVVLARALERQPVTDTFASTWTPEELEFLDVARGDERYSVVVAEVLHVPSDSRFESSAEISLRVLTDDPTGRFLKNEIVGAMRLEPTPHRELELGEVQEVVLVELGFYKGAVLIRTGPVVDWEREPIGPGVPAAFARYIGGLASSVVRGRVIGVEVSADVAMVGVDIQLLEVAWSHRGYAVGSKVRALADAEGAPAIGEERWFVLNWVLVDTVAASLPAR